MDSLTQGLLGAVVAQATTGKKLWRYAALIGFIAAIIADADIFIRSSNPLTFIIYHRQFSHSLIITLIGGALIGGLFVLVIPKLRPKWPWVILATILAYASHIILDAFTSYGTELYWPFSHARVAWNILPIVDPIATAILLVGFIFCIRKANNVSALITFAVFCLYVCAAAVQHHRAYQLLKSITKEKTGRVINGQVLPTVGQIFIWHSIYRYKNKIYFSVINTPPAAKSYSHSPATFALYSLKDLPGWLKSNKAAVKDFNIFSWFSDGYLTKISNNPLKIANVRFIRDAKPPVFLWSIQFEPKGDGYQLKWLWHQPYKQ